MRRMWTLAALLLCAPAARAGSFSSSSRGIAAARFLELDVGARAVSLGGAFAALADDSSALYWNPAGLTGIERRSAGFMHASHIDSSIFNYGAYGQKLGRRGAFGAGFQYFSAGPIAQTDAAGADIGTFSPYDLALSIGYAHALGGGFTAPLAGFSVGGSGKFIQSKILRGAQTAAVDLGLLSPWYFNQRFRWALTAVNMGGKLKFDQVSHELPFALRAAGALRIDEHWSASVDAVFPKFDRPFAAVGVEYRLAPIGPWTLAARGGFSSQTIGGIDGFSGISMGLGFRYRGYGIDYAFLPYGGVGQTHRISLNYNF